MKYVITGATSFIGSELCSFLLSSGNEVIAICRKESNSVTQLPKDVRIEYSSMADYRTLPKKIAYSDVFVNLAWAATDHEGRTQPELQWQNVEYSLDALIAARQMGCKLFVEAGSQAEYGLTNEFQTTETETQPFSEYGKAKLAVKEMAFAYTKMTGMKYIHLRIFSTYGENDKEWTLISSCIDRMLKNEPVDLSPCTQNWNFVYVKDAAKQIALLSQDAFQTDGFTQEVYHIASADTRVLKEFILELKKLTSSSSELHFGAIVPEKLVSLQPDMSKTRKAIGFVSDYSFADGIRNVIKHRLT